MKLNRREKVRLSVVTLIISAIAWVMLLINPGGSVAHCPVTRADASFESFQMLLSMNPVSSLLTGWSLMLVAMMSPTLIAPISHVIERSFKRRRVWSVVLFLIGYSSIWMSAGLVLIGAMLLFTLIAPQSFLPAVLVGVLAVIWQCSPVKQICINRGHNHVELSAFGLAADRDALHFGITHGVWCVGSCWLLMLFPMLLSQGHFAAMAFVTYIMISERLEHPSPLSWRFRFSMKLMRIAIAQTRIQFQNMFQQPEH